MRTRSSALVAPRRLPRLLVLGLAVAAFLLVPAGLASAADLNLLGTQVSVDTAAQGAATVAITPPEAPAPAAHVTAATDRLAVAGSSAAGTLRSSADRGVTKVDAQGTAGQVSTTVGRTATAVDASGTAGHAGSTVDRAAADVSAVHGSRSANTRLGGSATSVDVKGPTSAATSTIDRSATTLTAALPGGGAAVSARPDSTTVLLSSPAGSGGLVAGPNGIAPIAPSGGLRALLERTPIAAGLAPILPMSGIRIADALRSGPRDLLTAGGAAARTAAPRSAAAPTVSAGTPAATAARTRTAAAGTPSASRPGPAPQAPTGPPHGVGSGFASAAGGGASAPGAILFLLTLATALLALGARIAPALVRAPAAPYIGRLAPPG